MKLVMTSGQLAAEARSVPGTYAVLIEPGESKHPIVDHDAKTITFHSEAEAPKKAFEPPVAANMP